MKRIGKLVLCVLVLMSTVAVAYERKEQDGVVMTAHMFTEDQNETVTRGIKVTQFSRQNIFPIQIMIENNSQSTLMLDPHNLPLELADTFNMASFLCMYNAQYQMRMAWSTLSVLYSLATLIGTSILQAGLSEARPSWGLVSTIEGIGLGLGSLLMASGIKQGNLAGKVRDQIKVDLEVLNDSITINPGQIIKRTFFFELPEEDSATFYVTDQTNGKLLTFNFEIE